MRKRKISMLFMAMVMVAASSISVYAAEGDTNPEDKKDNKAPIEKGDAIQSVDTQLSYKVSSDYEVIIPESLELSKDHNETLQFTSTKMNTEVDYSVIIRITGLTDNKAKLTRLGDTDYSIVLPVMMGSKEIVENTTVARFEGTDTNPVQGTGTVSFGAPVASDGKELIKAGDYTGTVIFTVSYGQDVQTGGK